MKGREDEAGTRCSAVGMPVFIKLQLSGRWSVEASVWTNHAKPYLNDFNDRIERINVLASNNDPVSLHPQLAAHRSRCSQAVTRWRRKSDRLLAWSRDLRQWLPSSDKHNRHLSCAQQLNSTPPVLNMLYRWALLPKATD